MLRYATAVIVFFSFPLSFMNAQVPEIIPWKIQNRCEPFDYSTQKIQGYLGQRMDTNHHKVLLEAPYNSYLRGYKQGVTMFWPAGEYLGKYMQGLTTDYVHTQDQRSWEHTLEIFDTWRIAQDPGGFLGTFKQLPTADRWSGWTTWEHKYVLLGLLDYYKTSFFDRRRQGGSDAQALHVAVKTADLICTVYGPGRGQRSILTTGFAGLGGGSIIEPMTYLYQYTGDEKYLDFCRYVLDAFETEDGPKLISVLTRGSGKVNHIKSKKAYEMLSCIIGVFRMYQLTGEQIYLETAQNAWHDIRDNRLYITGTATQDEGFHHDHFLPADENDLHINRHGNEAPIDMGEACVTVHWMYLSRLLYQLTGELKYIDEAEKSLYNHLLGTQHPVTGRQSYYTSLIGHKYYQTFNPYGGKPPCCRTSVARCITRIPEMIWTKFKDNGLAILIYNSAEATEQIHTGDGNSLKVKLSMEADIIKEGEARIIIAPEMPADFKLALRVPPWSSDFTAILKNKAYHGKPGEYLNINRRWSGRDTLNISMKVNHQQVEGSPTYKNYYAFTYGPYVLALDQELNPHVNIDRIQISNPENNIPTNVSSVLPADWIGSQAYAIKSSSGKRLILAPFLDAGQNGSKYRVWIPVSGK